MPSCWKPRARGHASSQPGRRGRSRRSSRRSSAGRIWRWPTRVCTRRRCLAASPPLPMPKRAPARFWRSARRRGTAAKLSIELAASQRSIHIPLGSGGALVEATFLSRPNRFLVNAELNGTVVQAHVADRGRLNETLLPGVRLLLACHAGAHRKTAFQAVAAIREVNDLVSLDTHLPNRLIEA